MIDHFEYIGQIVVVVAVVDDKFHQIFPIVLGVHLL